MPAMVRKKKPTKPEPKPDPGDVIVIRHRLASAGTVVDSNQALVPAAAVEIKSMPPKVKEETETATDGTFHFIDLPAGQYELTAWPPGRRGGTGTKPTAVSVAYPWAWSREVELVLPKQSS
jgi:hypothetical protein